MNAPSYEKTPEAYRYPTLEAARDDLEKRHRATDELCREVEELLVILKALSEGAEAMNDERVDPEAFLHLAERLERAFTAVQHARTREWPNLVVVTNNDLFQLERTPGALFGVEHLDGAVS